MCSYCGIAGHSSDRCFKLKKKQEEAASGNSSATSVKRAPIRTVHVDEQVSSSSVRMLSRAVNSVNKPNTGVFSMFAVVGGIPMMVTLDTGADQVSCIDENALQHGYGVLPYKLLPTSDGLVSAGSQPLVCTGMVMLPIRLDTVNDGIKEMDVMFHVVRGLNTNCLLGTNFFLTCAAGLDWENLNKSFIRLWNGDEVRIRVKKDMPTETHVDNGIHSVPSYFPPSPEAKVPSKPLPAEVRKFIQETCSFCHACWLDKRRYNP